MDFSFTEEQEMLRHSARDFLTNECSGAMVRQMENDEKGYPPELWEKMSNMGWLGLILPEQYGGMDGNLLDLVLLLEELGKACAPVPFFSTVVLGGLTILGSGSEAQKNELLYKVSEGKLIVTLALTEPDARYTLDSLKTKATHNSSGWVLNGVKLFVTDAHIADYIICPALTEQGVSLFLISDGSKGLSLKLLKTLANDKQCEIILDKVEIPDENLLGNPGQGIEIFNRVFPKMVVAKCAEMVGYMQGLLDLTVTYAKQRVQFGHPIGSFQAIQHHCANMAIDVDASRLLTYQAASTLDSGLITLKLASIAKAWVNEACQRVSVLAAQVHGSIGLTMDHGLPLYYKRAKTAALFLGDSDFHREIVAQEEQL